MPARIPKPCRATRCAAVTTDRSGYCDTHADQRTNWKARQAGKTTTERGYGWGWQKLRKQALERDSYLCQLCLITGRAEEAKDVDHIINKASGGTDELSNLQSLCKGCHNKKTLDESRGRGGSNL